jgi:uncharacterized RmlC-like cupin family protein
MSPKPASLALQALTFGAALLSVGCVTITNTDPRPDPARWRDHEVKVITSTELNLNTIQTPGMTRTEAISHAMAGAEKLWVGKVELGPDAISGVHHHGPLETVAYVIRGKSKMRWGYDLEHTTEAGPGDFVYIPPYMPHQEMNASGEHPLEAIVIRSDQEPIVISVEIEGADAVTGSASDAEFHPRPVSVSAR